MRKEIAMCRQKHMYTLFCLMLDIVILKWVWIVQKVMLDCFAL